MTDSDGMNTVHPKDRPNAAAEPTLGLDYVLDQLERHRLRAHRAARARYLAAKHAHLGNNRLGVPVVILTATVSSAIFVSATTEPELVWVIGTGMVSLAAAALAALQTFFGYGERAAKYRAAASSYASLKRDLDFLKARILLTSPEPSEALDQLESIVSNIGELERESLEVPDRFYDRARTEEQRDDEGV